jgi:hypothetical protein
MWLSMCSLAREEHIVVKVLLGRLGTTMHKILQS